VRRFCNKHDDNCTLSLGVLEPFETKTANGAAVGCSWRLILCFFAFVLKRFYLLIALVLVAGLGLKEKRRASGEVKWKKSQAQFIKVIVRHGDTNKDRSKRQTPTRSHCT